MARICAFTMNAPGHLFPFMSLLVELKRRGHAVSVALCSEQAGEAMLAGIELRALDWLPVERQDAAGKGRTGNRFNESELAFANLGRPLVTALQRIVERDAPDLLLVDPALWGLMLGAKLTGRPWVAIAHNPLLFRGRGLDVRGPALPPPQHAVARLKHRAVGARLRWKARHKLATVNRVRAECGQPALRRYVDMYLEPTLLLATTVMPFEYPRDDWPANLRFVGPLLWDPPADPNWRFTPPDGPPLVLLVGSSIRDESGIPPWPDLVLRALSIEPYCVLATLPTGGVVSDPPPNAVIAPTLPHSAVLPHVACVICHAGPGITNKALSAGVPVVSVPYALDRFEVARRVELSGAGVSLSLRDLSPANIRHAVRTALSAPVRRAAQRVATQFAAAGGTGRAADLVEELLHR